MTRDFIAAAIPKPATCMGERLRSFSLGHVIILSRFGSGFVTDRQPVFKDLLVGLYVCRLTFAEAVEGMADGRAVAYGKAFAKKSKGWKYDAQEEITFFADYVSEAIKMPKHWAKDEGGDHVRKTGASFWALVKVIGMADLGLSEADVLNRPLALTLYETFVWLERQRVLRLWSEEDDARKAEAEAFVKAHPHYGKG